jgi:hypothetical protein
MKAALLACAQRATHAQENARTLHLRACAAIDAIVAVDNANETYKVAQRALADALRARFDASLLEGIVAAETAAVRVDAALELCEPDNESKTGEEGAEGKALGAEFQDQADKSLRASARALRSVDAFCCNADARTLLLAPDASVSELQEFLRFRTTIAEDGDPALVELLVADGRVAAKGDFDLTECLLFAARRSNADIVELLLQDGRADPTENESECLRQACWHACASCASMLQMLLDDRRADPTAWNSACLKIACDSGCASAVRMLLNDGRADPCNVFAGPSDGELVLLDIARIRGFTDIAELLLQDERIKRALALLKLALSGLPTHGGC